MIRKSIVAGIAPVLCCLVAACGQWQAGQAGSQPSGNADFQSSGTVTQGQAQTAVNQWLRGPNTALNGSATVVAVRVRPDQDWATADLETRNFLSQDGHVMEDEDPGVAVFWRGGSGTWLLTRVTWDGGRQSVELRIPVP